MSETASEMMVAVLREELASLPGDEGWWCPYCGPTDCRFDGRCDKCGTLIEDIQPDTTRIDKMKAALAAHDLQQATEEWHDHGKISPSCVGCPTAEERIRSGEYTEVRTVELIALNRCIVDLQAEVIALRTGRAHHGERESDGRRNTISVCWRKWLTGHGEGELDDRMRGKGCVNCHGWDPVGGTAECGDCTGEPCPEEEGSDGSDGRGMLGAASTYRPM